MRDVPMFVLREEGCDNVMYFLPGAGGGGDLVRSHRLRNGEHI